MHTKCLCSDLQLAVGMQRGAVGREKRNTQCEAGTSGRPETQSYLGWAEFGNAWDWSLIHLGQLYLLRNVLGLAHSSNQAERSRGKYSQSQGPVNLDTFYLQFAPAAPDQQAYMQPNSEEQSSHGGKKTSLPRMAYTELLKITSQDPLSDRQYYWQLVPSWDLKPRAPVCPIWRIMLNFYNHLYIALGSCTFLPASK